MHFGKKVHVQMRPGNHQERRNTFLTRGSLFNRNSRTPLKVGRRLQRSSIADEDENPKSPSAYGLWFLHSKGRMISYNIILKNVIQSYRNKEKNCIPEIPFTAKKSTMKELKPKKEESQETKGKNAINFQTSFPTHLNSDTCHISANECAKAKSWSFEKTYKNKGIKLKMEKKRIRSLYRKSRTYMKNKTPIPD